MTGNGQTDSRTDAGCNLHTHSHIILDPNRDVSSPHWFSNKTVPDTW